MAFASKKQQGFLFAKKPEVAKEFAAKTPKATYASMPLKVKKPKSAALGKFPSLKRMFEE